MIYKKVIIAEEAVAVIPVKAKELQVGDIIWVQDIGFEPINVTGAKLKGKIWLGTQSSGYLCYPDSIFLKQL